MRPVRKITAEEENFRLEEFRPGMSFIKRDMVEPEPVGTYVVMVFRVTGYDRDCDGSAMARLENVDRDGKPTGWATTHHGLYPDSDLVIESPRMLWEVAESIASEDEKE